MSSILINVKDASLTLHGENLHYKALHNVDFCLKQGEHVAIFGQNGAGKSTFLQMLAGLAWIDKGAGNIAWYYQGKEENSPIMARRMTALVSPAQQEKYIRYDWHFSGMDILLTSFNNYYCNISEQEQHGRVQQIATQLNCQGLLHMPATALSQGQLRILLLAQALLLEPQVLLLDEYLDGLDIKAGSNIISILSMLSNKITFVISSHREQGLLPFIKKQCFIHEGKLYPNKPNLDKNNSNTQYTDNNKQNLNTSNFKVKQNQPLIALNNATVFIERVPVLHNINWELYQGDNWIIQGKNGAGKSTFLRLLAGDEYPAACGSIRRQFKNHFPQEDNVAELEKIRKVVRLVSDHAQACYSYDLTGLELVLSGIDNVIGTYRTFSEQEIQEASKLLAYFSLSKLEQRRISSLSTGQFRRLLMARAIIANPQVLLLDEPFSGLDYSSRLQCMESLEKLALQLSIVMVSHHTEDCLSVINREARFKHGKLIITR